MEISENRQSLSSQDALINHIDPVIGIHHAVTFPDFPPRFGCLVWSVGVECRLREASLFGLRVK